ncbi:DUF7146 domain-containing protein [Plastoroseomonas arctica]|uniref:Virulence-associated protein E n=1 Tax=Plastoroseomonas arctica TaxID=1509237 RepID=A0AAF1KKK2_9PROT|nr:toprim domain-containing protein [Plastoroseomonas arctica]MBR0653651.1 virulence-associated protein E [Plastoroseomonas arctica]
MMANEIAAAFRMKRAGAGWQGDCPACGYATTFAVRQSEDGRALYHCHSCGDGRAIGAAIRDALGSGYTPPSRPAAAFVADDAAKAAEREKARLRAIAIWGEAVPIPGTLAAVYLAARGLPCVASGALRFHAALYNTEVGQRLPAMVAAVTLPGSPEVIAIHRTFLAADGSGKAAVDTPKKTQGGIGGGVIALEPVTSAGPLVIAEGIETALSARLLLGSGAAWAAIAAGNFAKILLPEEARDVIIAADPDPVGQREAWAAATRWRAEGRSVKVATPPAGQDFNDMLRARLAPEVANG